MNTYIMLASWTDQGLRNLKDSPSRLEAAKQAIKTLGGEFYSFHMTSGAHDMVVIYAAPSDDVSARFTLALAQGGNIRTQTLKAFSETEYRDIIGALS